MDFKFDVGESGGKWPLGLNASSFLLRRDGAGRTHGCQLLRWS